MFRKTALVCTISLMVSMTLGCSPTYMDPPPKKEVRNVTEPVTVHQLIKKYANKHNVDEKTIHAIVMTESGYNRRAVSKGGAQGLMQIMPATGRAHKCGNLFDAEKNIACGTKHYAGMLARYNGDEARALAAYNLGGGRVKKGQPIPKAGQKYVSKVMNNKRKLVLE